MPYEIADRETAATKQVAKSLRQAWCKYLEGLPWDHFVTLTFKHWSGLDYARREYARWIRRLEQEAQLPLIWFMALEHGRFGRLHGHSLVGNTGDLSHATLERHWR